jgi:hypothetical protein
MYDELTTDLRRAANTWLAEEYKVCAEAVRYLLKESADAIELQQKLLDGLEADNDSLCEKVAELQAYVALYKDGGETAMKVANDYKARIEELSAIREEQKAQIIAMAAENKPRWIPVTERFPERYTWVLVSAEKHEVAIEAFYDGAQWKDPLLDGLIVTHWMPLPQPPKEET